MTTIKTIIIDDESNSCDALQILVDKYCPEIELAAICHSGADAIQKIQQLHPQLIFLDIEMPYMNGFQMLEQIPNIDFEIIFTTSYDQYAITAFKFSALDYLLKPVDREELQKAVEKVSKKNCSTGIATVGNTIAKDESAVCSRSTDRITNHAGIGTRSCRFNHPLLL